MHEETAGKSQISVTEEAEKGQSDTSSEVTPAKIASEVFLNVVRRWC